jgi:hypothetical protein
LEAAGNRDFFAVVREETTKLAMIWSAPARFLGLRRTAASRRS